MKITKHTVAMIEYTLKDDAGDVLDRSDDHEPLAYVHGTGTLIPGLEVELEGRSRGDSFHVRIPPENAYGPRDERMIHSVARDQLPADAEIEVGTQFEARHEEGSQIVTVVGIDGDRVHLDANHPLAGVALNFDVTVVEVRSASYEEIEHGHVHGPGGHSHGHSHE